MYVTILQVIVSVVSLFSDSSFVIDYDMLGIIVGCLSVAELVRGHVKYWHGCAVDDWCYLAMPFGGAALTTTFWGIIYLSWGRSAWYEPLIYLLVGAAFYSFLGWLLQREELKRAKKAESR